MKIKINWKVFAIVFIVCGGLLYITRSFIMTLGILLVLIVIDGVLKNIDDRRRRKENNEQILRDITESNNPDTDEKKTKD